MRAVAVLTVGAIVVWAFWRAILPWPDQLPDWLVPPSASIDTPARPLVGPVDRLVVDKSDRTLVAMQDGRVVRRYTVALGFAPTGDKRREGDGRTPEGLFRVDRRNDRSKFHLSLGLDYPRAADRARARAVGVDPGGDIFIHGQPNGRVSPGYRITGDWTDGCLALADSEMEELFAATPAGTIVEIMP